MIPLSQGQLNYLETCPPKFQQIYLDQLASPLSPEQQEKLAWGTQFHLLMQQRELGLPIESLLKEDEEMAKAIATLIAALPENLLSNDNWREAEHHRSLEFQGYLLTAVYDLLIISETTAEIIDWKTHPQAKKKKELETNWQTRLYLYLLAETSDYLPEEISMTYWFVKQPKPVTIKYSKSQHQKTCRDLANLLTKLSQCLDAYINQGDAFPHIPKCPEICPHYKSLNSFLKQTEVEKQVDWNELIADIEEISI